MINKTLKRLGKFRSKVFRRLVIQSMYYINDTDDLARCIAALCGAVNVRTASDVFTIRFESKSFDIKIEELRINKGDNNECK